MLNYLIRSLIYLRFLCHSWRRCVAVFLFLHLLIWMVVEKYIIYNCMNVYMYSSYTNTLTQFHIHIGMIFSLHITFELFTASYIYWVLFCFPFILLFGYHALALFLRTHKKVHYIKTNIPEPAHRKFQSLGINA